MDPRPETPSAPRPQAAGATHVGAVRDLNEDAWTLVGEPLVLAAVADGMGGHEAGEVASAAAIETLRRRAPEVLAPGTAHTPQELGHLIHEADAAVVEVEDRGVGIDPDHLEQAGGGEGDAVEARARREGASAFGGQLHGHRWFLSASTGLGDCAGWRWTVSRRRWTGGRGRPGWSGPCRRSPSRRSRPLRS